MKCVLDFFEHSILFYPFTVLAVVIGFGILYTSVMYYGYFRSVSQDKRLAQLWKIFLFNFLGSVVVLIVSSAIPNITLANLIYLTYYFILVSPVYIMGSILSCRELRKTWEFGYFLILLLNLFCFSLGCFFQYLLQFGKMI